MLKKFVSLLLSVLLLTSAFSVVSVSASKTEPPTWLSLCEPAEGLVVPYGIPLNTVFTTTPRGDISYVKVFLDGELLQKLDGGADMANFKEMTTENAKYYAKNSGYLFNIELPAEKLTVGSHTIGVVAYESGFGEHAALTRNFTVEPSPVKLLKSNVNFNNFTGSFSTSTNNSYTGFPSQAYGASGSWSASDGADYHSETNPSDKSALCTVKSSSDTGVQLYPSGAYSNDNYLKGERVIFEMDVKLGQTDTNLIFESVGGFGTTHSLFRNDGKAGSSSSVVKYVADKWVHVVFDLDYVNKTRKIYFDGILAYSAAMTGSATGISRMKVVTTGSADTPTTFAFDNFYCYTVAPYANEIKYAEGGVESNAVESIEVPANADSVELYLTGAFADATNVASKVHLQKDGAIVEGATATYSEITDAETSAVTRKITISLPSNIEAGNYSVVFDAGLLCYQNATQWAGNKETPYAYSQELTLFDVDKLAFSGAAQSGYSCEVYYDAAAAGNATLVIATYTGTGASKTLSALTCKDVTLTEGINKLSASHTDASAESAKAFLISSVSDVKPLVSSASAE